MRYGTLTLICLLAAGALSGSPAPVSERTLLVLFSGYGTCKLAEPLGELKARLTHDFRGRFPGRQLDVIEYCFEGKARRTLRRRLGKSSFDEPTLTPREALLGLAEAANGYRHVGLVGHSWGGWTVLRAVQGWERSDDEDRPEPAVPPLSVSAVVSIDPISLPVCNPLTVLQGRAECLSFPPDIEAPAIRARSRKWLNYYQSGGRLHSGDAPTGDTAQTQFVNSTHTAIKQDARVLDETSAALLSAFTH